MSLKGRLKRYSINAGLKNHGSFPIFFDGSQLDEWKRRFDYAMWTKAKINVIWMSTKTAADDVKAAEQLIAEHLQRGAYGFGLEVFDRNDKDRLLARYRPQFPDWLLPHVDFGEDG